MGPQLTIIGMEVDTNKMTITMPEKSCADLLDAICVFAVTRTRHTLCEFQKLLDKLGPQCLASPMSQSLSSLCKDKRQTTSSCKIMG
jgi:hypothetical protein